MAKKRIHPLTGCRYDTILDYWMIPSESLDSFVNLGWDMVEKGELKEFSARSEEMSDNVRERPYELVDGLAKMKISGPMTKTSNSMMSLFGGTSMLDFGAGLKKAMADDSVRGFFIEIDSPGGTVNGTQELAHRMRAAGAVKPIFVHAQDQMTSAAQWVGAMGKRVTCGATARSGSVGVIIQLVDNSDRDKGMFGKPVIITTGKFKDTYAAPYTPEKIAEIKREQNRVLDVFWGEVSASRPKTKNFKEEILTARVFVGEDAVRVGLVDAVCSTDEAFERAKESLKNPTPVRGSGMQDLPKAAPIRSKPMPTTLTDQQIATLAKFPGGAGVTADNADHIAYNVATHVHAENTTLKQKVTDLDTALTAAKASAAPAPMDAALLRDRCETAVERLQIKLEKDKITSAQFATMAAALLTAGTVDKDGKLSADAKPDETMFQKVDGKYRYEKVFAAFDGNEPTGIVKPVTGAQPAVRSEPGKDTKDAVEEIPTLARVNDLRASCNEPLLTLEQYYDAYPEARKATK